MKRTMLRTLLLFTLSSVAVAATIPSRHSAPNGQSPSDAPLLLFQSIDKRLTLLDADSQKLQISMHQIHSVRGPLRHKKTVQQFEHSSQQRERLRTINQLLEISSRAEWRYHNRRQAYGAKLFRGLRAKLFPVRTALLRTQTAPSVAAWTREENVVNTRLLSVITQFQAISGGYVALACHPGSWACCQPRTVLDGKSAVAGCTWSCVSKLAICRGGCLGRRTPNSVVAVKNMPRPPVFAQSPTVASTKIKPKTRVNARVISQGSASGR